MYTHFSSRSLFDPDEQVGNIGKTLGYDYEPMLGIGSADLARQNGCYF
jgi:hypothetical protein